MALSDRERRELEQIEQSLYAEDPELDVKVRSVDIRVVAAKRLRIGIAIAVLGLAVLITGVALPNIAVGAVGFLLMLAGSVRAVLAIPRRAAAPKTQPKK